jgi:hypothetical protein
MIPDHVRCVVRRIVAIGNPQGAGPTRRGWETQNGRLVEAAGWLRVSGFAFAQE